MINRLHNVALVFYSILFYERCSHQFFLGFSFSSPLINAVLISSMLQVCAHCAFTSKHKHFFHTIYEEEEKKSLQLHCVRQCYKWLETEKKCHGEGSGRVKFIVDNLFTKLQK
jgi:hypothetical protein